MKNENQIKVFIQEYDEKKIKKINFYFISWNAS